MADLRKDLLRQMRALRASLDPKVVDRAKWAVEGKVPYDRDNAKAAVDDFLAAKADGGAFRRKLEAALKKEGTSLDEAKPADTVPPDSPPPRRRGRLT